MKLTSLDDLFARGLRHLHAAHHQGAAQTSINHEHAHDAKLKKALQAGSAQSLTQAERLEAVFKSVDLPVAGDPDRVMQGMCDDNNAVIARMDRSRQLDQDIIRSGQLAMHYYIATYGTLRAYAQALGHRRAAKLLGKTLDEVSAVDEAYTKLAATLRKSTTSKIVQALGVTTAIGFAGAGALALAGQGRDGRVGDGRMGGGQARDEGDASGAPRSIDIR